MQPFTGSRIWQDFEEGFVRKFKERMIRACGVITCAAEQDRKFDERVLRVSVCG